MGCQMDISTHHCHYRLVCAYIGKEDKQESRIEWFYYGYTTHCRCHLSASNIVLAICCAGFANVVFTFVSWVGWLVGSLVGHCCI